MAADNISHHLPSVQGDFFTLDIEDFAFKGHQAAMEHPLFSLEKNPARSKPLTYDHGEGDRRVFIEVIPSGGGYPTVLDQDILIYCISQIVAAKESGKKTSPQVEFVAHRMMRELGWQTSRAGYERLEKALDRLLGTVIKTNIQTGGKPAKQGFTLIARYTLVYADEGRCRLQKVQITLDPWLYRAADNPKELLTLDRGYFNLRPIERRLYSIARKHCGKKATWLIGLETLRKKCGSTAPLRRFKFDLGEVIKADKLPEYRYTLLDDGKNVVMARKDATPSQAETVDQKATADLEADRIGASATPKSSERIGIPQAEPARQGFKTDKGPQQLAAAMADLLADLRRQSAAQDAQQPRRVATRR